MDHLAAANVQADVAILGGGGAVKIDRSPHRDAVAVGAHPPQGPGHLGAAGRFPGHPRPVGVAIRHEGLAPASVFGGTQFAPGPGDRLLHLCCHGRTPLAAIGGRQGVVPARPTPVGVTEIVVLPVSGIPTVVLGQHPAHVALARVLPAPPVQHVRG